MIKKIVTILIVLFVNITFAQREETLLLIDNEPITISEFKQAYEKNLSLIKDKKSKNIDKNLDLFIDYKLKVKEAYRLKLDTLKSYNQELNTYKKQLIAPYLQDEKTQEELVKQAYKRTKEEVKVSHILLMFSKDKKDTVALFTKINNIRKRIINGEPFNIVAKETSEDPSVKTNGGDLGYVSAFKTVYSFENIAYKTPVGQVSKPFKTRFGYHIIKVFDKREAKGDFKVAHILVKNTASEGKNKIDKIYQALQQGENFSTTAKKYSEDAGTSFKGGKLQRFGVGIMVKPFENEVLKLSEGMYSKPFKTKYGWHIVKLLKHYPIGTFKALKPVLIQKIKRDTRGKLSTKAVVEKLKLNYKIDVNKKALSIFKKSTQRVFHRNQMQDILLTINNDKKIKQEDFSTFIRYRKNVSIDELLERFIDEEVQQYFKDNLEKNNTAFKQVFREYKDGLLLFELLQRKIWNVSSKDSVGLQKFYNKNNVKYKKPLKAIRGEVVSDYQRYIEKNWIDSLKNKYNVTIKKRALKKLKKQYNQ